MNKDYVLVQSIRVPSKIPANMFNVGMDLKNLYGNRKFKTTCGKEFESEEALDSILQGFGVEEKQRLKKVHKAYRRDFNEITDYVLKAPSHKRILAKAEEIQDFKERVSYLMDEFNDRVNSSLDYANTMLIDELSRRTYSSRKQPDRLSIYVTTQAKANLMFQDILTHTSFPHKILDSESFKNFLEENPMIGPGEGFDLGLDLSRAPRVDLLRVNEHRKYDLVKTFKLFELEDNFRITNYRNGNFE